MLKKVLRLCFIVGALLTAPFAFAAIQNISATVSFDGTAPFDTDNAAGNDAGLNNKIIRTQDTFEYLVSYEALDTNNTKITFTAPDGIYWTATSLATSVCNGPGGGSLGGSGNILYCNRKPSAPGIESFYVRGIPGNIANGTAFTTTVTAGTATAVSESLTVSATPKNQLWWIFNNHTKMTVSGEVGTLYTANFEFGALVNADGNIKGYESLNTTQTVTLEVGPGGYPYNCGTRCSQPGGPGTPIIITLNIIPNFTRYYGAIVGSPGYLGIAAFRGLGLNSIQVFTPHNPNYPVGQITPLVAKAKDWDPVSMSGVSNFGLAYAPGYDPSYTCPTSGTYVNTQQACMRYSINRTVINSLVGLASGASDGTTATSLFSDDNWVANGTSATSEPVVVGQKFRAMVGINNEFQAEEAVTNAGACVVWDPLKMELFDTPVLKSGVGTGFSNPAALNWPNVASDKHIIEFTSRNFSSDTDRKTYDCGKAGDANSEWYSSVLSVPGGMTAVTGVRYKYLDPFAPNDVLGVVIPLVRPNTSYSRSISLGTRLPWFQQYYADQKTLTKSSYVGSGVMGTGGAVVAFDSLFRATSTISPASIAPGTTATVTFTPITIAPVGDGIDTQVKNASVTFSLPANNCLLPVVPSLPAGAVYTPGNFGPDGIPCTGDAGESAGSIKFSLGDLVATSGVAGDSSGHRTSLTPISFNLLAAATATVQSTTVSAVTAADSDPSPANGAGGLPKSMSLGLSINGVSAFSTVKSVSGVTNGKVGPNEVFTYTINFGNGGSSATGVGRFVDILPFDGDRNGTIRLGTGKMQVVGLAGAMSQLSQGTVTIQTSTDSATAIEAAIATVGNESGQTGVTWTNYTGGAIPTDVTAVRFVTSNTLNPSFSGYGSIQVKAPTITQTTSVINTVNARTDMINSDVNSVKFLQKGSAVTITGLDGATLRGTVYYDLNANGVKDASELGIQSTKVVITCTAGACLTAPQGSVFSMLTDSGGGYGFEPNVSGLIFANDTASGTALSSFQGVIAGTWTITESPPTSQPHVNVSTTLGTINGITSGSKAGRSITGVAMVGNGVGINYNFGERLEHGKITVTKALSLPSNVSGPFNFTFTATCDKPVAGSVYTATLSNYPTNTSVDIINIPADSSCVMSETLPTPPNAYTWATPSFSALTPSGALLTAGTQTTTATNALVQGVNVTKTVVGTPTVVVGNPTQFDVKYKIEVSNTINQALTYSLSDTFGFDPDVAVVGTPSIVAGTGVTGTVNASFTGAGANKNIVTNESIAAGSVGTPTIETYEITVRVNVTAFTVSNNTCNAGTGAGLGLFNTATLTVNSRDTTSSACTNTPVPVGGKITVTKALTLPSDVSASFNFGFKATCDLPTAGSEYSATLSGYPGSSTVDILNIPAGATCTVSETLPSAPNAYSWSTPVVGSLSPAGTMTPNGTQSVTVTNALVNGLTISKTVDAPVAVTGQPDQFDVTYHVTVSNATASALSYDLSDSFGFDSDLQVVGTPTITKTANVTSTINSSFNGVSSSAIVTAESIAAASGSPLVPVVETYDVKVRVKVVGFIAGNNSCSGTGTGLFNTATATVGGISRTSSVCTSTPDAQNGKMVITKALTIPAGVATPINLSFKATCDKPTANTEYTANLAYSHTNKTVEIAGIPAGSSCVMSETLPSAPTGFQWKTPVIGSYSPSGTMPAGGSQAITITNELLQGITITKTVVGTVDAVAGQPTQFDATYKIEVSNATDAAVVYSLNDSFGFDPDVSVLGTPVVTKSGNVTQSLTSGFTGATGHVEIINSESIAAAVSGVATVQSYTIKVRINMTGFNAANNSCNSAAGNGLFNSASMVFGSVTSTSSACSNTPAVVPVFLKLRKQWVGGKPHTLAKVPPTTGFTSANTSEFESMNMGVNNYTDGSVVTLSPSESGVLPNRVFVVPTDAQDYAASPYSCTDGVMTPIEVKAGATLAVPVEAAGKTLTCTITSTFISFASSKTAEPASGSSVAVGDTITYTLKTVVTGASSLKDLVLTDTLDAGLTVVEKPNECVLTGQIMVCTLAAGASVGEHSFIYKTVVNEKASSNKVPGVQNKVVASSGACEPCETQHSMWSVDTAKTSDAKGKKGIEVGQSITYTLTLKVKGGKTTQDVILKDTRSVGLEVSKVPSGCQQKGLVMTCVLPSGSAAGEYQFVYTAVVTDDAGDFVSNKVVPNKGTCLTVCQTSIKVLREVMLRITKTTNSKVVKIGDFVRYELLVENLTGPNAKKFYIIDQAAPGLNYVEGSLKVVGDDEWKLSSNYPLKIEQLELDKGEKLIISYLMRVGAGAGRGSLKNTAWADDVRKYVSSNKATASVTRGLDPDFEATRIFGRVFEDSNENGLQDENESGLAGVRLITTHGLIIETDSYGRYHLEDLDPGVNARGGQFIIRLDESSLPKGAHLTTENPQIKRITPALPVQFNFGVTFAK